MEVIKPKTVPAITRALTSATKKILSPNVELVIDCNRYSSKTKLLRVTAQVMCFIKSVRGCHLATDKLTVDELNAAEKLWIHVFLMTAERNTYWSSSSVCLRIKKTSFVAKVELTNHLCLYLETANTPSSKTSLYRSCYLGSSRSRSSGKQSNV